MSEDRSAGFAEAARRGLIPQGAYQEALKRGLVAAPADTGTIPIAGPAERDRGIAAGSNEESTAQAFRRGFGEGFGEGAPISGPISVITQPVRAAMAGISGLTKGAQEALSSTGRLGKDIAAMPEAFLGSPGGVQMPMQGVPGQVSEGLFPGASTATPLTVEERAKRVISRAFSTGQTTALDALDKISEARQAGQPMVVADVGGKPIERLAGTVYRAGGEPAAHMGKFYEGRGTAKTPDNLSTVAGSRIENAVGKSIAEGSYREATENLIANRSARGKPLWDKAMAGGSTAPLEQQFSSAFNDASRSEQESLKSLAQVKAEATQAAARQSQAGNVYASSGANRAARESAERVKAAEADVAKARQDSDDMRARLRQAQDDGTANAPGAVWSPRIQEFLNLPKWREGIRRGLAQERQDAVTESRPFNPSEYAIIGEKDGEPIVGAVPTTKLLQIAREGISAQIEAMRDPLTGQLTKAGRSLWRNLQEFEQEAFRLNPAWKTANNVWSGDSSSIRALQLGKKVFALPLEDLQADFGAMSASDKELFRLGAASKMIEDVRKTPLAADPSKRIINTSDELQRFRTLFENQDEFNKFADFIDRERTMFEKPREIMRGSQTAERQASDAAGTAGLGAVHLAHGNYLTGLRHLARAIRDIGLFRPKGLELEIAKQLTNPNAALTDMPFTPRMVTSMSRGGILGADDVMRRAAGGQQ